MKTDSYSLTSFIKHPTCYKNPSHPKCIDLILTNVLRSFQTTCVIETGLTFKKLKPRVINYRSYKHFSNELFRESLLEKLS